MMKLSVVDKYRWSKIDDKYLFPVSTNGGNYDRCDSSIPEYGNKSLLCLGKKYMKCLYLFYRTRI